MFTKNSYYHPRFKVLTESCISVQYSARPGGIILFLKDNTSKGCIMGPKLFKSRIYKNSKNIFSNFLVLLTFHVQLASIKNISWNYENTDLTSKQGWPLCGYLAGKAHASKRPKLQVLQTTGTFPMIATWFLLAAKTSYLT